MQATPPSHPRLLVTGATGRVGRLLAVEWARRGASVVMQRRADRAGAGLPVLVWAPLDGPRLLLDWVERHGVPEAMLVLSGVTPGGGGDLSLNIALAEACMAAAYEAGIRRVLLASTAAVYGGGRDEPWHEGDTATPTSAYGAAKLATERAAEPWRGRGLSVSCLRIGNVAGADALLLNAGQGALAIDRFADGSGPVRSYIGPQSLARVVQALADPALTLPPVLNVAAPRPVAMVELASAAGLDWRWRPAPDEAVARYTLDCSALAALVLFDDTESGAAEIAAQWIACREAR